MDLKDDAQAVIDELKAMGPIPAETVEPRIARELPTPKDAVLAVIAKKGPPGRSTAPTGPAPRIEHRLVPGRGGDILVRIYSPPAGARPLPVLVYFHGGGWVIANLDVYDASARALCREAGAIVVSVAYRQAPEAKFPAAVEDAYAATQWVFQNAAGFGGDPERIAIAGESAGGNLATVTCLMAKERGGAMPVHQLLVYPVISPAMDTPSYREATDYAPLNSALMAWFWKHYLASDADKRDWRAVPSLAPDLSGLPPATVITAEFDPLRDEGEAYAQALLASGVPTTLTRYDGVPHEFFSMDAVVGAAADAVAQAARELKLAFRTQAKAERART